MGLIMCSDCRYRISDSALFCPNCGRVNRENFFMLFSQLKEKNVTLDRMKNIDSLSKISENEKNFYILEYKNEAEFKKMKRALKKICLDAFKKLVFEIEPSLREGKFLGVLVSFDEIKNIKSYEVDLLSDSVKKFYGIKHNIKLYYMVYLERKEIVLEKLTPEDFLIKMCQNEITTDKDKKKTESHKELDILKMNLLNMIEK